MKGSNEMLNPRGPTLCDFDQHHPAASFAAVQQDVQWPMMSFLMQACVENS